MLDVGCHLVVDVKADDVEQIHINITKGREGLHTSAMVVDLGRAVCAEKIAKTGILATRKKRKKKTEF